MTLPARLYAWSRERFPIAGAGLYGAAIWAAGYLGAPVLPGAPPPAALPFALGAAVVFLVLLHLRLLDEHKDYARDREAHPDRLLSRGIVTLADLRLLLWPTLVAEAALAAALGPVPLLAWAAVALWSFGMYREFWAPAFLDRNYALYLLSHQLIVPGLVVFAMTSRAETALDRAPEAWGLALGVTAATITYEIARKTWSADREHPQADSYTRRWGRPGAVAAGIGAATACAGTFALLTGAPGRWVEAGLLVAFVAAELAFLARPDRRGSKLVEGAGVLFVLGSLATVAAA